MRLDLAKSPPSSFRPSFSCLGGIAVEAAVLAETGECWRRRCMCAVYLDAFLCWVQRDSYLPQGSQGLKAVTTRPSYSKVRAPKHTRHFLAKVPAHALLTLSSPCNTPYLPGYDPEGDRREGQQSLHTTPTRIAETIPDPL